MKRTVSLKQIGWTLALPLVLGMTSFLGQAEAAAPHELVAISPLDNDINKSESFGDEASTRPSKPKIKRSVLKKTAPPSTQDEESVNEADGQTEASVIHNGRCTNGLCDPGPRVKIAKIHIPVPPPRPHTPRPHHVAASEGRLSGGPSSPLPHAREIQRALGVGPGAGKNMCALAVWRILIRAGLAKGSWAQSGANGKDMGGVLRRQGFKNDMSVCNRPGVVRVYGGNASGRRFYPHMAGDDFGHIEILGLDHQFHSFYSSPRSITASMQARFGYASRRPLIQCWYKP